MSDAKVFDQRLKDSILVYLDGVDLNFGFLGDEVQLAFSFLLKINQLLIEKKKTTRRFINQKKCTYLFLESEGNATNWTLLDALHKVSGETSDLVSESLSLDHCNVVDNSLIYMEVVGQPTKRKL